MPSLYLLVLMTVSSLVLSACDASPELGVEAKIPLDGYLTYQN